MGGDIQAGVIIRDVVVLIMAGSYFCYCPKELRTMKLYGTLSVALFIFIFGGCSVLLKLWHF